MITMNFKAMQEGFFDRQKVIDAVDKATHKVLSKFGAFVMTRARSSIRKRKKASQPGQPPSSHVGLLKSGRHAITFSYDVNKNSVVIGPTLTERPTGAPEILEYGGITNLEFFNWKTRSGKRVREKSTVNVSIKARPFMNPAFEAEKGGLPAMWENSVR